MLEKVQYPIIFILSLIFVVTVSIILISFTFKENRRTPDDNRKITEVRMEEQAKLVEQSISCIKEGGKFWQVRHDYYICVKQ